MPEKPAPSVFRAAHVQAALARAVQAKMPERVNPARRASGPALVTRVIQKADAQKKEPEKPKILDLRPKAYGDPNPLSNYQAWIPAITNAAQYGVDKAAIVYVTNGWHWQNPGTPIQRLHFDISLDGGATKLHVYHDSVKNTVSIG